MRLLCPIHATLLIALVGCTSTSEKSVSIGDASPRFPVAGSFSSLLQEAIADPHLGVQYRTWSSGTQESLGSEVAQAEIFSAAEDVVAVVGHAGSKYTLLASPVYREAGMPVIVPTGTAAELAHAGPLIFMLAPPDSVEGAFLADRALDSLRAQRIAALYVADEFGMGMRDGLFARLTARGRGLVGEAVFSGRECLRDRLGVRGIVRALLQRTQPDVVVMTLPSEVGACAIKELIDADSTLHILVSDSFDASVPTGRILTARERAAVQQVVFWEPGPDSLSQAFVARARRVMHRDPDGGEALAYDAFMLIMQAMREGYRTRVQIGAWLQSLGTPGHAPVMGVTGPISFRGPRSTVLRLRPLPDSGRVP